MGVTATIFFHWFLAILALMVYASAALPLIIALGLIFGRRANARYCLLANARLLNFTLLLGVSGLLFYPLSYLSQILAFSSPVSIWGPFFSPPGMPWSTPLLAWFIGFLTLLGARAVLPISLATPLDRYPFKFIKLPFWLLLGASLCFFASFILFNLPFAGLPMGMNFERAAIVIVIDAFRHYFMAFSPAGAFALVYMTVILQSLEQNATPMQISISFRWLAVWAAVGYVPGLLQKWAVALGLSYRGSLGAHLSDSLFAQVTSMALLTGAIFCWAIVALKKGPVIILAWLGFALLVFKESLPFILKIFSPGA